MAFEQGGDEVPLSIEIDAQTAELFRLLHAKGGIVCRDITDLAKNLDDLQLFGAWCGGPPCQAFSRRGYQLGWSDMRSLPLICILLLMLVLRPSILVLENVAELFEDTQFSATFYKALEECQYGHDVQTWTSSEFTPQARTRCICMLWCRRRFAAAPFHLHHQQPGWQPLTMGMFRMPLPVRLEQAMTVQLNEQLTSIYLDDRRMPKSKGSTKYPRVLRQNMTARTVLHSYGTADSYSEVLGQILQTGDNSYRFLTPQELAVLFGFPISAIYVIEQDTARTNPEEARARILRWWAALGNSVPVPILRFAMSSFHRCPASLSWIKEYADSIGVAFL